MMRRHKTQDIRQKRKWKKVFFAGFLIIVIGCSAAQTVTTGTVTGNSFCTGSFVGVPYTVTGTFNAGNVFTAQLSSASGSFASPVNIGSLAATAAGTIDGTLPFGSPPGSGYMIRVVSSSPVVTGTAVNIGSMVASLSANTFQNNYTGSTANSYYEGGRAVIQTSDGGFAMLGYGINLIKLDPSGNILWGKQIYEQHSGSSALMEGDDIRQTTDGGFIIGAHGTYVGNGAGSSQLNILLVKTDPLGNNEWAHSYGDNTGGYPQTIMFQVRQTSDGGYVVSGCTAAYGFGWDDVGGKPLVMKVDSMGNVKWTRIFPDFDINTAWVRGGVDCEEIPGSGGDLMIWGGNYPYPNNFGSIGFLARTHSDGTVVWSESVTGNNIREGGNMAAITGGFYLGISWGISGAGIIKVDYNGNILWSQSVNVDEYLQSIDATADGGCVLSHGMLNYDAGIVKLSSAGAIQWAEDYSSGGLMFAMCVRQTQDKGYVVEGTEGAVGSGTAICLVKTDTAGIAGGTETAMTYSATNGNCVATADTMTFSNYTTTLYPTCIISSDFNPSVTPFTGGNSCTLNEMTYSINTCDTPQSAFLANKVLICAGSMVAFMGTSSGTALSWNWTFEGGTPGTSTSQNPSVVYNSAGYYDVRLIITTASGADTVTKAAYITVLSNPVAGVVLAAYPNICPGATANLRDSGSIGGSLQWQASLSTSGFSDIAGAYFINFDTTLQQTMYFRVVKTGGGCSDTSAPVAVAVVNSSIKAGELFPVDTSICAGATVTITDTGYTSGALQWQYSDSTVGFTDISNADSTIYSAALNRTTYFRVINALSGCADTTSAIMVLVNLQVPPALNAMDTIICAGDSTLITSSGSYNSYHWNDGDTRSYTYAGSAGAYWVSVYNAEGCEAVSGHLEIATYPVPSVSIVQQGDTLSSFNSSSYQWFFNDSLIDGATSSVYLAHRSGNYAVQIIDSNGCKTLSNYTPVTIAGVIESDENAGLSIYPNPNSVGSWQLAVTNGLLGSMFEVYNDEGRIVFQSAIRNLQSEITLRVAPGVYFLQISSSKVTIIRKLVKL